MMIDDMISGKSGLQHLLSQSRTEEKGSLLMFGIVPRYCHITLYASTMNGKLNARIMYKRQLGGVQKTCI